MKSLLVSAFFLFTVRLAAQQQSLQLVQEAIGFFNKGEYEKVVPVAEKALDITRAEMGEQSPFHTGMVLYLAMSHLGLYHFTEAENWMVKHNNLILKYSGERSLDYIAGLNRLAYLRREMGKYPDAEASYQKSIEISRALTGEKDTAFAKSLNNLASLYQFMGQYAKAEKIYIQARNLLKSITGESLLYAGTVNNLATLYGEQGQYEKAKPLTLQVLALRKKLLGEDHPDYAQTLNNLGYIFASLGQYKEAELNYSNAVNMYKKLLGENHPDYASSINNLAELYITTGEYQKAEELYLRAREIRKKTIGENHPDYSQSLNNLASLYGASGQYELAQQLLLESKERIAKSPGENHPYYVTALNNLAVLYHKRGEYVKAEPLYQQAKETRKKLLGGNHPNYAMSLNNLAALYLEMGQYEKAEPLFITAAEIWKKSLGAGHYHYAMSLNNLAAVYEDMEQYDKAEPLYIQARDIRKAALGEYHNEYAISLNNLAGLYAQKGEYAKAESLITQANAIWKKILTDNNPNIALGLNNLAAIYRKGQIKPAEAEQLYLEAIGRRKKVLGDNHPLTSDTENDLALLYMNMKQYKKAEPLFLSSSRKTMQHLLRTFPVLSEKEKAGFINENLFFNDCNNSFLYNNPQASAAVISNNLNLLLFFKSLSLADTRNMLDVMRGSSDESVKKLVSEWYSVKSILAAQYSLPEAKRMKNLAEKEAAAESLEKELNRLSATFRKQQSALNVNLEDVKKQLEDDEAAIEFVSFRYYNKSKTDSIIYAAYILRKQLVAPVFVPLFEEKQLQQLIDRAGRTATLTAKNFYGVSMNATPSVAGELYNLVWKPLEKHLGGIKKISLSPSGKLYGIAFHALSPLPGKILQDQYELRQYVSTKQIAFRDTERKEEAPSGIALFGDAEFNMDSASIAKNFIGSKPGNDMALRGGGSGWPDLPFTATEVDSIKNLFDRKGIKAAAFLKTAANESRIKQFNNQSPPLLHIATHGFYIPETTTTSAAAPSMGANVYKLSGDPLLRNGLILAGGNYTWGGKIPVQGTDDGVLTAYEIAQLNLTGTRLVVLSACETALGDIKGSEGVFGLQRAFKMAGIDKMIVSLWQVPDKETSLLMTKFYTALLNGASIRDAFSKSKAEMRKDYPPFTWAAFVLIE